MRIGVTGAAHLLRTTPWAISNWASKDRTFPTPTPGPPRREWDPADLEAWATVNWERKATLRAWAIEKGYAVPEPEVPASGVSAEDWDRNTLMRRVDIARHLALKQTSGGRIFTRLDFPAPAVRHPDRWDSAAVLAWAEENSRIKSLERWVGSTRGQVTFDGYLIGDIAGLLGLSTRAAYGLMEKDASFPLEIAPGGWDRDEVNAWKAENFDSPGYRFKKS
jgi:predicted DNA-binding transcriptional regulator AlpA